MAGLGTMRTYLGTAPGVGKTYAMLDEGRQRAERGEHVVVGWVEHHERPATRAQLSQLARAWMAGNVDRVAGELLASGRGADRW